MSFFVGVEHNELMAETSLSRLTNAHSDRHARHMRPQVLSQPPTPGVSPRLSRAPRSARGATPATLSARRLSSPRSAMLGRAGRLQRVRRPANGQAMREQRLESLSRTQERIAGECGDLVPREDACGRYPRVERESHDRRLGT